MDRGVRDRDRGPARHRADEQQLGRSPEPDRGREGSGFLSEFADRRRQRPDPPDHERARGRQPAPRDVAAAADRSRGPAPQRAEPAARRAQPPGRSREPLAEGDERAGRESRRELRAGPAGSGHGDPRGARLHAAGRAGQLHAPDRRAERPDRRVDARDPGRRIPPGQPARGARAAQPVADRPGPGAAQQRRGAPGRALPPADLRAAARGGATPRSCTR